MDVQCERCKTEYEFDDALVSGRGTTVKCTNCGYQFKIHPAGDAPEVERWSVRTTSGQTVVFTSLRELQKGITNRQVGRGDTLSRGNAPPRLLGSIAELEPFFGDSLAPGRAGAAAVWREGGGPAVAAATNARFSSSRAPPPLPPRRTELMGGGAPPSPPDGARPRIDTLRPPSEMSAAVPPPGQQASAFPLPPASEADVPTRQYRHNVQEPPAPTYAAPAPTPPPPPPARHVDHASGPPPRVQIVAPDEPAMPAPTDPIRMRAPSYDDLGDSNLAPDDDDAAYGIPRNRRVGGWIVAAIVLLGASGLGYYAFRPYLSSLGHGAAAAAPIDPRAAQFLTDGERALVDGNLDSAKENFDKASALAEKDAHVLLDVARLSAVRADIPWLRLRLLPDDAADDIAAAKQNGQELSAAARKAADLALASSPDDPAAVRAKIDALRIAGDRDGARALVAKIIGSAAQPETAYVLAALDLAELDPLWPTILDRLRIAVASEGNLGRARAALVYALARSGDAAGAKVELDKLAALSRPHPLLGALRAYVGRAHPRAVVDGGAPGKASPATVDVSALPVARPAGGSAAAGPPESGSPAGGRGQGGVSGDPRVLLEQAETAKNHGDYDRAKMLYEATLAKSPGDSQALAGLGDAARAQHDDGSAKAFYQRALAANPNYMPALIGLADVELAEGDQARAQKAYKDIVDRFPEGSYPARVKQHAVESSSPPPAAPTSTAAPAATQTAAPAPAATGSSSKEVTVPANVPSDLPGNPP